MKKPFFAVLLGLALCGLTAAQDKKFDQSKVPMTATSADKFVPAGWKLEEAIKGDLNGDGKADYAIKIVQDVKEGSPDALENDRVLILAFEDGGKLKRMAIADTLLQCTSCGGALYGAGVAPADIKIDKGVLIIEQESGSREVTDTTYRFRFDEQPNMFILIGFDYAEHDRGNGDESSESTNYLTGKRVTTTTRKGRTLTKASIVEKKRMSISEVNDADLPGDTTHRLGLD